MGMIESAGRMLFTAITFIGLDQISEAYRLVGGVTPETAPEYILPGLLVEIGLLGIAAEHKKLTVFDVIIGYTAYALITA